MSCRVELPPIAGLRPPYVAMWNVRLALVALPPTGSP